MLADRPPKPRKWSAARSQLSHARVSGRGATRMASTPFSFDGGYEVNTAAMGLDSKRLALLAALSAKGCRRWARACSTDAFAALQLSLCRSLRGFDPASRCTSSPSLDPWAPSLGNRHESTMRCLVEPPRELGATLLFFSGCTEQGCERYGARSSPLDGCSGPPYGRPRCAMFRQQRVLRSGFYPCDDRTLFRGI